MWRNAPSAWPLRNAIRSSTILPLFHAFGYSEAALMSYAHGCAANCSPKPQPDQGARLGGARASDHRAWLRGTSTRLERCAGSEARDLSSLRTGIFAAGTHSATPIAYRGSRLLKPLKALSAFGMTEVWVGACLSALDDDEPHRLESSGYPAPGYEIKVSIQKRAKSCHKACRANCACVPMR